MAGLRDAALIERDDELSVIDQALRAACGGASRLLVLDGPPGIGKTRLLAALRDRSHHAGLAQLSAHASPLERSYPFGVARQLFDPALSTLDDRQRRAVLSGQARSASRPLGREHAGRASEDAIYSALNGLFWLCVNLAELHSLAITIDDAHWSDDASLRFLAFAAMRLEDLPVLVALTARPTEPGTDAPALIAQLQELSTTETLTLRPLSRDGVSRLLAPALGTQPSRAFATACHTVTGGNPLLLHELLIEAHAAGVPATNEGARLISDLGPARVSASVLARVGRLGETAARLTRALAILGDRTTPTSAAALSTLPEPEVLSAATELADVGVLGEGLPLRFAHPLVRQAIYEHLPYAERLAAHTRAARILAASGARPEQIAAHLLITQPAHDPEVVELLRRAAAEASVQGSPECAVSYLRRALNEPPAAGLRGELLAELGIAEHNANHSSAIDNLSKALALATDPSQRAQIGLVLARAIWHTGKITDAVRLLARLVDRLDPPLAVPLEAELIAIARLDPETRAIGLRRLERHDPEHAEDPHAQRLLLANLAFEYAVAARGTAHRVAAQARRALGTGQLLEREGSESTIYYLTYGRSLSPTTSRRPSTTCKPGFSRPARTDPWLGTPAR